MSYNIRPTTIQTSEAAYFSPPRQRPLTPPIVIDPLFAEEIFSAPTLQGRVTLLNNSDTDPAIAQQDDPIDHASRPEQQEEPAAAAVEEGEEEVKSDSEEEKNRERNRAYGVAYRARLIAEGGPKLENYREQARTRMAELRARKKEAKAAAAYANVMLSGLNGVDYFRGANIPEAEVATLLAAEPALSFEMQFPPPASSAQQDDPINHASRPDQQEEPAAAEKTRVKLQMQKRQAATEDAEPAREDSGSKKASTTQSQPQILPQEEKKEINYREQERIYQANYRARLIAEGGPKLEASRENARRRDAERRARKKAEKAAAAQAAAE